MSLVDHPQGLIMVHLALARLLIFVAPLVQQFSCVVLHDDSVAVVDVCDQVPVGIFTFDRMAFACSRMAHGSILSFSRASRPVICMKTWPSLGPLHSVISPTAPPTTAAQSSQVVAALQATGCTNDAPM
eukprot:CAMPEP_0206427328 /NCGR_PEP_ID=MMETSP0324_2-20121206/4962_1 /ASSEMBLY_ACC=CAM_ASM_000836 /TAXON_ID=2866 /ORGANISM="Crypthecodinium cohnii, Strain Seligo" /LENGTH=128 /DNA_ID=CAMNT_0053892561 /DNA_START=266 /DNA_END=653 /DNA_ORIENTATION=-